MSKFRNLVTVGALSMMIAVSAVSEEGDDKKPGSGPNPFTDCGIGAALFPNTGWAAVSSNVIWDIGVTAVISATASPETCQAKSVEAAKFINETYPSVVEQTAQGGGEHLSAMLEIFGCSEAQHDAIIQFVRPTVGDLVESSEYAAQTEVQKAAHYYNVIHNAVAHQYASSCDLS